MKGKKRHRAISMEPIAMSDFLRQAAVSFGAKPEPTAFMTVEGKPTIPLVLPHYDMFVKLFSISPTYCRAAIYFCQ